MYFILQCIAILSITLTRSKPLTRHVQTEWVQYFDRGVQGPGSYVFGYDVEDGDTNNVQFRQERRNSNGTVIGSYGLLEPDGNLRIVHYVADTLGYRAQIENTKKPNEVYPESTYKDNFNNLNSARFDEMTKSPYLQSAEQNLPFLGTNLVHEQHVPPVNQKQLPSVQGLDTPKKINTIPSLHGNERYYPF